MPAAGRGWGWRLDAIAAAGLPIRLVYVVAFKGSAPLPETREAYGLRGHAIPEGWRHLTANCGRPSGDGMG